MWRDLPNLGTVLPCLHLVNGTLDRPSSDAEQQLFISLSWKFLTNFRFVICESPSLVHETALCLPNDSCMNCIKCVYPMLT
ncbi:hypothetical protein F4782DRAFT_300138 [Xylaria castorea]|nr:hypothetical protein F4782DRAFT_300138 [Xylaria castorea]